MRAHRVLGDVEAGRDLVGTEMLVEQQEHLDLSGGKLLGDIVRHASHASACTNPVEEAAGD